MNIASLPVLDPLPTIVAVSELGVVASTMTVPVLGVLTEVEEAQVTDRALPPVRRLAGVNPSGELGFEQALPIAEVDVFGSKLRS
jgi:hypothetical protein